MEKNKISLAKSEENESKTEIINDTTDRIELNSEMQIIENSKLKSKKTIENDYLEEELKKENENLNTTKKPLTFITETSKENPIKKTKDANTSINIINEEEEEEKEKGHYYFPMIINKIKKEDYNSISFLFKHPPKPIDTSKKINFKTNPGLFKGPIKKEEKEKRDLSQIKDLMSYIQEMFHIPASSRSINIPYEHFRERMKQQFFSRHPRFFGNFKFPPKNIMFHRFDETFREEKLIKERNIARMKLPKIKKEFHYNTLSDIPKNVLKDYNIGNLY